MIVVFTVFNWVALRWVVIVSWFAVNHLVAVYTGMSVEKWWGCTRCVFGRYLLLRDRGLWNSLSCIFELLYKFFGLGTWYCSVNIMFEIVDFVIFSNKFGVIFFAEAGNYGGWERSRKKVCSFLGVTEVFIETGYWSKVFRNCFDDFWFVFIYSNSISSRVVQVKMVKIKSIWLLAC